MAAAAETAARLAFVVADASSGSLAAIDLLQRSPRYKVGAVLVIDEILAAEGDAEVADALRRRLREHLDGPIYLQQPSDRPVTAPGAPMPEFAAAVSLYKAASIIVLTPNVYAAGLYETGNLPKILRDHEIWGYGPLTPSAAEKAAEAAAARAPTHVTREDLGPDAWGRVPQSVRERAGEESREVFARCCDRLLTKASITLYLGTDPKGETELTMEVPASVERAKPGDPWRKASPGFRQCVLDGSGGERAGIGRVGYDEATLDLVRETERELIPLTQHGLDGRVTLEPLVVALASCGGLAAASSGASASSAAASAAAGAAARAEASASSAAASAASAAAPTSSVAKISASVEKIRVDEARKTAAEDWARWLVAQKK